MRRLLAIWRLFTVILAAPYRMYHGRYAARVWDEAVLSAEQGDFGGALNQVRKANISNWEREIIPFDLLEGKLLLLTGDNRGAIERLERFVKLFNKRGLETDDLRNYLHVVADGLCDIAYQRLGKFRSPVSATKLRFELSKVPIFYQKTFPLGDFADG